MAEMMDEGLRLGIAAGEAKLQIALGKIVDQDGCRGAERRIQRLEPAVVEIARRHRVDVIAKERFDALVNTA